MRTLLLLAVLPSICLAASATQTDWSGGDCVQGPVPSWGDSFDTSSGVSWLALPGDLHLSSTSASPVEHGVQGGLVGACGVYSADIDGDGDTDILGAAYNASVIAWWQNIDGAGTSWIMHTVESFPGAYAVKAADMNGDGDVDIIGAAQWANAITWWENSDGSGASWIAHPIDVSFSCATSVHVADIDDDGDMDVMGAAYNSDCIAWWENADGSGTSWIKHTVDDSYDGAAEVFAADVNGDGDMDMLGSAHLACNVTWWENSDGSGTAWIENVVDGSFDGACSVYAADVDGDGDEDVLDASQNANDITWWENTTGSGTVWIEHTVDGEFGFTNSVHAADVDGDGNMDVLGASAGFNDITWWENADGPGSSWTEHLVDGDFSWANSVCDGDIDGDGDIDLLGAAQNGNEITWWEVSQFLSSGQLTSSILDTGEASDWGQVTWTESIPANTDLTVELRAGDNPGAMGSWILIASSGDEIPSGFDGMRYIQYRITMTTGDNSVSPCLEDIAVDWTPFVGIEDKTEGISAYQLPGAYPNPALGSVELAFSVPLATEVELSVYDLSGRIVAGARMDCAEGSHVFTLDGLAAGVYLVQMRAGEFEAAERFVVIR